MATAPSDRKMNDSTMPPPPSRQQKPRGTATNAQVSEEAKPRNKVAVRKGFGLSDWNILLKSAKDLALRNGQPLRKIPWDEIRQHDSIHDGWIVLRGKVYFISPYLAYHPGGEAILKKALGRDASSLFDKYHRWVNEENLIGKLLIGYVDNSAASGSVLGLNQDGFAVPAPKPPKKVDNILPSSTNSDDEDSLF